MTKLSNLLSDLGCCSESKEWAKDYESYKSAWGACDRPDWILTLLEKLNYDRIQLRLIGAWCARNTPLSDGRTTWDLLTDERSKHAIEVAENPESTEEELETVFYAALSAANSATNSAASSAANSAALSAANSATNSAASSAANSAAYYATNFAADSAAACKAQADYIRSVIKLSDVIKLIKQREKELA
jgi:hypothetical protein